MKDAKRNSVTVPPSTDWGYTPHEHEELLRMAEKRRMVQAGGTRQPTPPELRMAPSNEATVSFQTGRSIRRSMRRPITDSASISRSVRSSPGHPRATS
jgi:hypothetical protein